MSNQLDGDGDEQLTTLVNTIHQDLEAGLRGYLGGPTSPDAQKAIVQRTKLILGGVGYNFDISADTQGQALGTIQVQVSIPLTHDSIWVLGAQLYKGPALNELRDETNWLQREGWVLHKELVRGEDQYLTQWTDPWGNIHDWQLTTKRADGHYTIETVITHVMEPDMVEEPEPPKKYNPFQRPAYSGQTAEELEERWVKYHLSTENEHEQE